MASPDPSDGPAVQNPLFGSRSLRLLELWLLLLVATCGVTRSAAVAAVRPDESARALLVAFRPGVSAGVRAGVVGRAGMELDPAFRNSHVMRLRPGRGAPLTGAELARALRFLRRDPSVRLVEPDYEVRASAVPNDPRFAQLWALHNTGQTGGQPDADIDWLETWESASVPGPIVAVVDTGVDYTHPDLQEQILRDGGGAVVGWDFANNDANPQDDHGHGTHVAGTIGAVGNNGIGIVGVCPTARIMPLKFLDGDGVGATSNAIRAIDFAVASGAAIINNSWGGGGFSGFLLEAIQRAEAAGVLVVAAAGNDGEDNDARPVYPASYNRFAANVLSVAASDARDELAAFSNYGRDSVDITAPGAGIVSTAMGGGYITMGGTSMATPHVSGAAALTLARFPGASVRELKERLLNNADRPAALGSLVPRCRLNVARAMVDDTTPPGTPAAFTVSHFAASGLLLTWTASGDDGVAGTASRYEMRYSTIPLDAAGFEEATPTVGLPVPGPSGSPETFLLPHLAPGQDYYVLLRAVDRVGNVSSFASLGRVRTPPFSPQKSAFSDDVEGGLRFIGSSPWAVSKEQHWSPTRAYADSPAQPYAFRVDSSLTQLAPVSLAGFVPVLTFYAKTDLEPGFDFLYVEVSADDGETWSRQELALTGVDDWRLQYVPLGRYFGQSIRVRFRLVTDEIVNADGVWLDEIRIAGDRLDPGAVELPRAPGGPGVTAVGRDRVDLVWQDLSDNEAGFKIERRSGPTPFVVVGVVGADTTHYSDMSASPNTLYRYRIRATNAGGDSAPTSEVEALTLPEPPPPPGALRAAAEDTAVTLVWSAAVGATSYRVFRASTAGGPYLLAGIVSGPTTYRDPSVGTGIRYYYVATSVGPGGESVHSNEASATPGLTLPLPPTRVRAKATRRRVTVTWNQSASPEIVLNRVYRARTAAGPWALIVTVSAGRRFVDRRVGPPGAYYYRVTALDMAGHESPPSEQSAVAVGRAGF